MSENGMAADCVPALAVTVRAKASAASSVNSTGPVRRRRGMGMELGSDFIADSFVVAVDGFGERSGARGVLDGSGKMQNSFGRFGTPSTSVRKPAVRPPIGADAFIK
jgi:hypothetical protein